MIAIFDNRFDRHTITLMVILSVSGITKQPADTILSNIHFTQNRFQKLAIAGETGSGKSTLLKVIAGLVQPDSGEVTFEGEKVKGPDGRLVPGQPGISYLSQSFKLPGFLRVDQVLAYSNVLTTDKAQRIYKICGIDHLLQHKTNELSGGEMQRIALARELIASPRLLLLDEPYSNLDVVHKSILKKVIHDIGRQLKMTFILVSHDPVDVLSWADEILILKAGKLIQTGAPQQIYAQPDNQYVASLFGKYNLITPAVAKELTKTSVSSNGKQKLMIRPEKIRLVQNSKNSAAGTIEKILFCGSYVELDITFLGTPIKVFSSNLSLNIYDMVRLKAAATDIHVI